MIGHKSQKTLEGKVMRSSRFNVSVIAPRGDLIELIDQRPMPVRLDR
jgi:hypothetical protein